MLYRLTDHFIVDAPLEKTWAFFSVADNLPRLTPPAMKFRIDSAPPGGIEQDSILDYTVHIAGLPMRWRTLITVWNPPTLFVDLQTRGPYALWHHRHTFASVEAGTECTDQVIYRLPMGFPGRAASPLIRRQLLDVFRFRRKAIEPLLGKVTPVQPDVEIVAIK